MSLTVPAADRPGTPNTPANPSPLQPSSNTRSPDARDAHDALDALGAAERVAVILSLLPPDEARALARKLDPGTVDRVIAAYEAMGTLPRPVVLQVIARFVAELTSPHPAVRGGARQAQALLGALAPETDVENAPEDDANEAPRGSIAQGAAPEAVWAHVEGMAPDALAALFGDERPAVIAAAVPRLSEAKAGALLSALPEQAAVAVARLLAGGRPVAPPALDAIAESLRVRAQDGPPAEENAGETQLTALLNRCPFSRQEVVLASLRDLDEPLAGRIEAGLLRIDSLPDRLPRTAVPMVFREVAPGTLDPALRYALEANSKAAEFLFSNISQRLAEQIRERVAALPLPDPEAGERAVAQLIGTLLGWAQDDRFALKAAETEG